MSFNRILVALDRSLQEPEVLERAIALAESQPARLMLLHCVTVPIADATITPPIGMAAAGAISHPAIGMSSNPAAARSMATGSAELDQQFNQIRHWMQEKANQAVERGVSTEYDCRTGDAGSRICELAREWNADLVVVGRRGRSGLKEVFLGSVSNYVVHHSPCAVLVIQDQSNA